MKPYNSNTGFVRYSHEEAYLLAKGVPDTPPMLIRDVLEWHYSGNGLHPTQKPAMAMLPLIMAWRTPVFDSFVGSGTTAVAAKQLGRRYIGIGIDPTYARQADERVKQAQEGCHPSARQAEAFLPTVHHTSCGEQEQGGHPEEMEVSRLKYFNIDQSGRPEG